MRLRQIILLSAVLLAAAGCTVSRNIVDVRPPTQGPLQQLDQHLTYVDPQAGRPDYIVQR